MSSTTLSVPPVATFDQATKDAVSKLFTLSKEDRWRPWGQLHERTRAARSVTGKLKRGEIDWPEQVESANFHLIRTSHLRSDLPYYGRIGIADESGKVTDEDVELSKSFSQIEHPIVTFFKELPSVRATLMQSQAEGDAVGDQIRYLDHLTTHMLYLKQRAQRDQETVMSIIPTTLDQTDFQPKPSVEATKINLQRQEALHAGLIASDVQSRADAFALASGMNDKLQDTIYHYSKGPIDFDAARSLHFIGGHASLPLRVVDKLFEKELRAAPSRERLHDLGFMLASTRTSLADPARSGSLRTDEEVSKAGLLTELYDKESTLLHEAETAGLWQLHWATLNAGSAATDPGKESGLPSYPNLNLPKAD